MRRIRDLVPTRGLFFAALFLAACVPSPRPFGTDLPPAMVAVSGDIAVVGVPCDGAHVFVRSGDTWTRQTILRVSAAPSCTFAQSVAISGDTILVGDTGDSSDHEHDRYIGDTGDDLDLHVGTGADEHHDHSGAAYVFVRSGTIWSEQIKLTHPPTDEAYRGFGAVVALSGDTATVLSGKEDHGSPRAAIVFTRTGNDWRDEGVLPISRPEDPVDPILDDPTASDIVIEANAPLAASGDLAVVRGGDNATYDDDLRVFARANGIWTEQARVPGAGLESALIVSSDRILVGGPGGAAMIERDGASWAYTDTMKLPKESIGGPGLAAISGDEIIVSGASTTTFTFVRSGKTWTEDETRRRTACEYLGTDEGVIGMSGNRVVQAGLDRGTLRVCDL